MRKYKFRGKGIADNEWYFGDLIQTRLGTTWIITEDYTTATEEISLNTCASPQVKAETVGQYTGLHDKNGKEIYEGDIVKSFFVDTDEAGNEIYKYYIIEVKYDEVLCSYKIDKFMNLEVIGNIYENKELLNETNR